MTGTLLNALCFIQFDQGNSQHCISNQCFYYSFTKEAGKKSKFHIYEITVQLTYSYTHNEWILQKENLKRFKKFSKEYTMGSNNIIKLYILSTCMLWQFAKGCTR